jgi:hypothetical protein
MWPTDWKFVDKNMADLIPIDKISSNNKGKYEWVTKHYGKKSVIRNLQNRALR